LIKSQITLRLFGRGCSLEKGAESILGFPALLHNYTKISFFLELVSDLFRGFTTSFSYCFKHLLVANTSLSGFVFRGQFDYKEVEQVG
jgi:hypothetical protein